MADRYVAQVGIDYTPDGSNTEKRAEPGDLISDLPTSAIPWLLKAGHITEAPTPKKRGTKELD